MEILHVSAECYPVAKVGGLGDVVGALPKYQQQQGCIAKVVMPCYRTRFLIEHEFELVHQGGLWLGPTWYHFNVIREKHNLLGFDLYLLEIPGLIEGDQVYGCFNDLERFTAFQIGVMEWLNSWRHHPDVMHCHDHHAGLIPFMMNYCYKYDYLRQIPTVFTIHNAQYQGQFGWDKAYYLPAYDPWKAGMLDWNHLINPLAAAVKCSWKITTVSPHYLEELCISAGGLEALFRQERHKAVGILNGIDTQTWDPQTDARIVHTYDAHTVKEGKLANKMELCRRFQIDETKPLFVFIGRLVYEKGADLLPDAVARSLYESQYGMNFILLGSGDPHIEWLLRQAEAHHSDHCKAYIGYDETLSHQLYAAADFLLMPSRIEPCGLNQMYAMRYGTVPIVRAVGGLYDTVIDIGDPGGYGIRFLQPSVWDITHAISRAMHLYQQSDDLLDLQQRIMQLDFSWDKSAQEYLHLYAQLKP